MIDGIQFVPGGTPAKKGRKYTWTTTNQITSSYESDSAKEVQLVR